MAAKIQQPLAAEETLVVPVEWINKGQGIAMDIGCETTRVLYQPKSQLQQWKLKFEGASHGKVRMFSFPTRQMDRVLDFILSNADVVKKEDAEGGDEDVRTIYVTGVHGAEHRDKLTQTLGVQIELVEDPANTVAGFNTLVHYFPEAEVVYPRYRTDEAASRAIVSQLHGEPVAVAADDKAKDEPDAEVTQNGPASPPPSPVTPKTPTVAKPRAPAYTSTDKAVFPCVLAIVGNSTRYLKVEEDGSYEDIRGENIGAGYATGLASLILKTKTFGEAVKLAEKGDDASLNLMGRDVNADDRSSGPVPDDLLCQPFAKAAGCDIGKFKREDAAAALVDDVCSRIAYNTHSVMAREKMTRVYFCGDLPCHELVRRHITRAFAFFCALLEIPVDFYFVRETSYLDVLGAFTYHLTDSSGEFDLSK